MEVAVAVDSFPDAFTELVDTRTSRGFELEARPAQAVFKEAVLNINADTKENVRNFLVTQYAAAIPLTANDLDAIERAYFTQGLSRTL